MGNAFSEIAVQAKKHGKLQTLMHYVNEQTLAEEHKRQVKGKAVGIDGVDKVSYGEKLNENLANLLARMKSFSYRPRAVRRT